MLRIGALRAGIFVVVALLGRVASHADGDGVVIRVVGPDGAVPARCTMLVPNERGAGTERVDGGRIVLTPSRKPRPLLVYGALDAAGHPLPWGLVRGVVAPDAKEVELRLPKGLEIHGRIVDETGAAVPGAWIRAELRSETWLGSMSEARADATGAFVLGQLGAEEYVLRGARTKEASALPLANAKGGDRDVRLALPKTTTVSLTVVDYQDRPVAGASVGVWRSTEGGGASLAWEHTDGQGNVRIEGVEAVGPLRLEARGPSDRPDLSELRLRAWTPADGRIEIPRGYVVTGTVRDAEGKPVRATVLLHTPVQRSERQNEPDGTFRLERLPYGPVTLEALPPDSSSEDMSPSESPTGVEVTPERPLVDLVLTAETLARRQVPLILHILAPDGKPVERATISWSGGWFATSQTVEGGRAEVATRGAAVTLRVFAVRDAEGRALPVAPVSLEVDATTREVTIRLEPGREIRGRVLDEDGKPVPDLVVHAVTGRGFDFGPDAEARTREDGTFLLVGLGAREYTLRLPKPSAPWASPPDVVTYGGAVGVAIRVRRAEVPELRVLDMGGLPVVGATVIASEVELDGDRLAGHSEKARATSGANGEVLLEPSDPTKTLHLQIVPPTDRDDLMGFSGPFDTPKAWDPKSGPIHLARGFTITGTVRDAAGKGVRAGIWRDMTPTTGTDRRVWHVRAGASEADGTFRIRSLPYGPIRLTATRNRVPPPTDADGSGAGPSSVKLVTPEKPTVELTVGD